MSERQLTAREFFGSVLLDSLKRNFQLDNSLIMFFDPSGRFLSWTGPDASLTDSSTHPYRKLRSQDVIGDRIYRDAVRDRLDYFNTEPRLYRSTDLIAPDGVRDFPLCKIHRGKFRRSLQCHYGFRHQCVYKDSFFQNG